ncbi:MAG: hypothetical protein HY678_02810 [Chloroflexi bacterium]|nr:hypothetical protein [Chloroflexota bacterium]
MTVKLGSTTLFTGDNVGQVATVDVVNGLSSVRYVGRHHSRISARVYNWLGGTDNTAKSTKLHAFMDAMGFTKDVYDPFFGASNDYDDDFQLSKDSYPDPAVWPNYPKGEGYTPYRSTLTGSIARDMYIGQLFRPIPPLMTFMMPWNNTLPSDGAYPLGLTIRSSPFYDCSRAMHRMQKYGTSKASEAKDLLRHVGWDGYGTRRNFYVDLPGGFHGLGEAVSRLVLPERTAYEGYSLPCFLAACSKLYELNGDSDARQWAQEAADMQLKIQWKYDSLEYHNQARLAPEHIGGFMGSYRIGSDPQFTTQNSIMTFIRDTLSRVYIPLHERSFPDYLGFVPVSGEPSGLGVMGLLWYKRVFGDVAPAP